MEHRLILGGAQYLPFARSRIKAMRGTGLDWCTERFDFGDAQVEVRLEGRIDYIKIEGGGCTLLMDSGVVALLENSLEFEHPGVFAPGVLTETDHSRDYNAGFIQQTPGSSWRTQAGDAGQITGDLTSRGAGKFKGKVPQDGVTARSFAPRSIPGDGLPQPDTADGSLWAKKVTATKCPASMFTGRCRMWVQAMYGMHTTTDKTDGAGTVTAVGEPSELPVYLAATFGQPALMILAYRSSTDEPVQSPVFLGTSTGVHLDPATGKHWMFVPTDALVEVYPLKGSICAEALRKYLRADSQAALSADDKEHLEAYILSTCRPIRQDRQVQSHGAVVRPYSMGYGWHWNWAGLTADIVTSTTRPMPFENGFEREGMTSTHWRMQMVVTEGSWSAAVSLVEGPSNWSVNRSQWCIAEPNWIVRTQEKATPKYSSYTACSAPFYAFYVRDNLQICRISVTEKPLEPPKRVASPIYYSVSPYGTLVNPLSVGLESGYADDYDPIPKHHVATISCGDVSFGGMTANFYSGIRRFEQSNKSAMDIGYAPTYNFIVGNSSVEIGTPSSWSPSGGFVYSRLQIINGAVQFQVGPRVQYDHITSEEYQIGKSEATVIIPFYDAEAVFFQAAALIDHQRVNRMITRIEDGGYITSFRIDYRILDGDGNWIGMQEGGEIHTRDTGSDGVSGGPSVVTPTYGGENEVWQTDVRSIQRLIGHAGVTDATMTDLYYYHDLGDYCQPTYWCRSGSRTSQPTVMARDRIPAPIGTQRDGINDVIVGWI